DKINKSKAGTNRRFMKSLLIMKDPRVFFFSGIGTPTSRLTARGTRAYRNVKCLRRKDRNQPANALAVELTRWERSTGPDGAGRPPRDSPTGPQSHKCESSVRWLQCARSVAFQIFATQRQSNL